MRHFIWLTILVLLCTSALEVSAQRRQRYKGTMVLYPTFQHYLGDSGIVHNGNYRCTTASALFGGMRYNFRNEDKHKVQVRHDELWGFKWGEALYRMSPHGEPMYVAYNGKVVYYEVCDFQFSDGMMVTPMTDLNHKRNRRLITESVISADLNSTLYAVRYSGRRNKANLEGVLQVLKPYTNGQGVFNCLTQKQEYADMRECIKVLDESD